MTAPFKTAVEFCAYVEGELGWAPRTDVPRFKAMVIEASNVKKRIAKDPAFYTWDNLYLVVQYLKKRRKEMSPTGCVSQSMVFDARRWAGPTTKPVADIALAIRAAIATEQSRRDEDWEPWVRRLTRAQGAGRDEVYAEWARERAR